jgi:hypothetical protein
MAKKENSLKKGKTVQKYELGKHRADLFGHYSRDYYETGKVPQGFHI